MAYDAAKRRTTLRVTLRLMFPLVLGAATLTPAVLLSTAADAQGLIRTPNLHITPRISSVTGGNRGSNGNSNPLAPSGGDHGPRTNPNPTVPPKVGTISVTAGGASTTATSTNSAGAVKPVTVVKTVRAPAPVLTVRNAVVPVLPYVHYSPNLYPACGTAYRDGDGECLDEPVASDGGSSSARQRLAKGRRNNQQAAVPTRRVVNELVAEIDGTLSDTEADELARRHGLTRIASQNFPLLGATIGLFRIADRRSLDAASRDFAADGSVRSVQPNFRYLLQDQKTADEGDPAQYALAKLHLPEAHALARGADVKIAIIDSGIDASHPELTGAIADSFDALGSKEGPHVHGTGIAGVIASHARLMGSAPAAKIIAIRAFGQSSSGAESNSYVILKSLDYAAGHGAQIVNMSFAGPKDALIERGVNATAAKGMVMIAAAGNAGIKSPPLYPAANPNVIAVSATDADDKLFSASNRGSYIAIAAPGVDIFLPAPDQKYQITSGTSFSAAYVSGLAALMLERNSALKPDALRALLINSAHDLGSPGRDDFFGAGEADAYAAVQAAIAAAPAPMLASEPASNGEKAPETTEKSPIAAVVTEKTASGETKGAAAQ
jgi:subtilisin family serine protease